MSKEVYRYIWFLSIFLKQKGYSEEDIIFKVSRLISPYFELNNTDLNDFLHVEKQEKIIVEVNPFLRFTGIFELLLDPDFKDNEEIKEALFNIFIHINNFIDLQDGLNRKIILSRNIVKEIENGYFGDYERELFEEFNTVEKLMIAENIQELYSFSENMDTFKKIMKKIFKDSIIYDNIYSEIKVVIYINETNNIRNKKKLNLIKNLFLPLDIETKVFWENHFGVIGVSETMKIGETAVY